MSFQFDLHSAAVSVSHLPCHAHAMPMPCSDHAVLLKTTAQHGRRETAVLSCGFEKKGMVGAWHGHGMGMAWAWHGNCESDTAAMCKSKVKDTS